MSGTSSSTEFRHNKKSSMIGVSLVFGIAMLVIAAVTLPGKLPILVAGIAAIVTGYAIWKRPEWTTLLVVFLIYSNLPVVAVKFHGAPGFFPAAVISLLMWPLLHAFWIGKQGLVFGAASPWLIIFTLGQYLSSVFSKYPTESFESFVSFLFEGLLIYLVVTNLCRTRAVLIKVLWALAFCAILMGGVPLIQQFTGIDSDFGGLAQADSEFKASESAVSGVNRQRRFAGTIGEQNRYAQFMMLLLPIGITLISITRSPKFTTVALIATLCAFFGFSLAFSRGAAVGFVLALLIGWLLGFFPIRQFKWVALASVFVLILLPQYAVRLASISTLFVNSNSVQLRNADGATRGRLTEMGAAILVFRDHSLLGVGPGIFPKYSKEYGQHIGLRSLKDRRQAHCMPLDIAAENGLWGVSAFAAMLLSVLVALYRMFLYAKSRDDSEGRNLSAGMAMSLLFYLTTSLFLHLSYIRYFWLLLALVDSTSLILQAEKNADGRSVEASRIQ